MIWGKPEAIKGRKGGEEEDVTSQHELIITKKKKKQFRLLHLKQVYMRE